MDRRERQEILGQWGVREPAEHELAPPHARRPLDAPWVLERFPSHLYEALEPD